MSAYLNVFVAYFIIHFCNIIKIIIWHYTHGGEGRGWDKLRVILLQISLFLQKKSSTRTNAFLCALSLFHLFSGCSCGFIEELLGVCILPGKRQNQKKKILSQQSCESKSRFSVFLFSSFILFLYFRSQ